MTKKINGGTIGLEDLMRRYGLSNGCIRYGSIQLEAEEDDVEALIDDIGVLRKGARGDGVKIMQEALGIGADGVFGPGTERALKAWQSYNGLVADGIVRSNIGKTFRLMEYCKNCGHEKHEGAPKDMVHGDGKIIP